MIWFDSAQLDSTRFDSNVANLPKSLSILAACVALAGSACAAIGGAVIGPEALKPALLASLVTLASGVAVLFVMRRGGNSPAAVLGCTLLRLVLVSIGGGLVWLALGPMHWKSYLLSLGATYLAALAAETWLLLEEKPAVLSLLFKSRVQAQQ